MLKILIALSLFCCIISCQQEKNIDLEPYYFPHQTTPMHLQYEYASIADTSRPNEIWQYRLEVNNDHTYLVSTNLDNLQRPMQINREEIVENGTLLRQLQLINYDTSGVSDTTNATILGNNMFPFSVKDSTEVFYYKVSWTQESDGTKIELTRNRRYLGQTKFIFENKEVVCARFLLRELLITETEGQTRTQWSGEEWYAKDIGLVYFRKNISPSYQLEYKLISKKK